MSIEYFVEGKVKYDFKGDYKTFSKGNITNNAAQEVKQKGAETGVSYNKPLTIDENDIPYETIDVSLNLFFDGTQNNKTNTESRVTNNTDYNKKSNKDDDSYMNDYSNVARGYNALDPNADRQAKAYVEGIGTVDGARDTWDWIPSLPNNIGGGLGEGPRGVKAKVTKGCMVGAKAVRNKFEDKKINVLKVNVYGFSRGATAARHFIHVATTPLKRPKSAEIRWVISPSKFYELSEKEKEESKESDQGMTLENLTEEQMIFIEKYGYFGACLVKEKIKINEIFFNFVGVYDTVASFGANHRGTSVFGINIIDDDAKQLNLDAVKKAHFCLHITSDDEYRDNFSLTNINSTGLNGLEFTLPGVHSDIGGSYVEGEEETRVLYKGYKKECEEYKKILEEEGWYTKTQLEINLLEKMILKKLDTYELRGTRILSNQYDRISLNTMFHYSKQFGVKYDEDKISNSEKITNKEIDRVDNYLKFYMNKCINIRSSYVSEYNAGNKTVSPKSYIAEIKNISYLDFVPVDVLKNLRNKYLHWSVSDKTGMGPNVEGITTVDKRKRYIIKG